MPPGLRTFSRLFLGICVRFGVEASVSVVAGRETRHGASCALTGTVTTVHTAPPPAPPLLTAQHSTPSDRQYYLASATTRRTDDPSGRPRRRGGGGLHVEDNEVGRRLPLHYPSPARLCRPRRDRVGAEARPSRLCDIAGAGWSLASQTARSSSVDLAKAALLEGSDRRAHDLHYSFGLHCSSPRHSA